MIEDALFLTGTHRSGTTLLEKLMNQLSGVSVLSQPFPLLFIEVKRAFLQTLGVAGVPYPLGDLFLEQRYDRDAFAAFLRDLRPSREQLRTIFADMRDYSGQYTRFTSEQVDDALAQIGEGDDFASVVRTLNRALSPKTAATWFGSKETICEEFLPALLDRGVRCLLILRDPRDVIASLDHGRGADFRGAPRPLLFNVRNWRKSVAYALALQGRSRFHSCRYEDLVRDPAAEAARITSALGIDTPPLDLTHGLRDADGEQWRGNSSHGDLRGISGSSVGAYKTFLDPRTQRLIEAACLPELRFLRYETTLTTAEAARTLGETGDSARENETERLTRIAGRPGPDSVPWFLFEKTHDLLSGHAG